MKDVLIIPDVHGRTFWRPALQNFAKELTEGTMHCVFLGDYLDPYEFEIEDGICEGYNAAIRNFKEILLLKEALGSSLTLLLGNHDLHYIREFSEEEWKCRYMYQYEPVIVKLFMDNWKKFRLAYECVLDSGCRCLLTHAGVMKAWVDTRFDNMAESDITAEWLNSFLKPPLNDLYIFNDFGHLRGGYGYGSPVWADAEEFFWGFANEKGRDELNYEAPPKRVYTGIYQIFGHSLFYPYEAPELLGEYYICENYAMLDSRKAFVLHSDGKIEPVV